MRCLRRLLLALGVCLCCASDQKSITIISASDSAQLKSVFFSGDPWLVQCGTKADISGAIVDDGFGAHVVVERSVPGLPKEAKVGLLDCHKKLPSGKTTVERFKLDSTITPLLVLAANGKTLQITPSLIAKYGVGKHLFPTGRNQAAALASLVKAKSEPKAYAATSSEHIQTLCLKRKHCAIMLMEKEPRGEMARAVHQMLHEFRTISFVTVNTARYEFSLARHLPAPTAGTPQIVALRTRPSAEGDKRKVSLGAKAHRGEFGATELREFFSLHESDELQMTPLKKIPTLRWRKQEKETKKDVKKEKKKNEAPGRGDKFSRQTRGRKQAKPVPPTAEQRAEQRERETERREQMAAEEDEALRSMFADPEDDEESESGEGGDTHGDDGRDDEVVNFDEAEGGHDEL